MRTLIRKIGFMRHRTVPDNEEEDALIALLVVTSFIALAGFWVALGGDVALLERMLSGTAGVRTASLIGSTTDSSLRGGLKGRRSNPRAACSDWIASSHFFFRCVADFATQR